MIPDGFLGGGIDYNPTRSTSRRPSADRQSGRRHPDQARRPSSGTCRPTRYAQAVSHRGGGQGVVPRPAGRRWRPVARPLPFARTSKHLVRPVAAGLSRSAHSNAKAFGYQPIRRSGWQSRATSPTAGLRTSGQVTWSRRRAGPGHQEARRITTPSSVLTPTLPSFVSCSRTLPQGCDALNVKGVRPSASPSPTSAMAASRRIATDPQSGLPAPLREGGPAQPVGGGCPRTGTHLPPLWGGWEGGRSPDPHLAGSPRGRRCPKGG